MVASINGMSISPIALSSRKESKYANRNNDKLQYYTICLNKAFSQNVVDYAHTVYSTITNLKDTSKQLLDFIDEYKTVEDKIETLEDSKKEQVGEIFNKKAQAFVNSYDAAYHFSSNQKHSKGLLDFSYELLDITAQHQDATQKLEVDKNSNAFGVRNMTDVKDTMQTLENIKSFVDEIYLSTQNIMSKPMAEHMNFNGSRYYYNYKLDVYYSNTFELIESGMIVDVAL